MFGCRYENRCGCRTNTIKVLQNELDDLHERRDSLQGELNWFLVSDGRNVDEDAYIMKMKHVDDNVEQKEKQINFNKGNDGSHSWTMCFLS